MKHRIFLALGPCCPLVLWALWGSRLGFRISMALGIALWMIFWWITRPVGLTVTALQLVLPCPVKQLEGTREYFRREWKKLGSVTRDEKLCLGLFGAALVGSFLRPLYAPWFPQLQPAYLYGSVGFLLFFLTDRQGNPFLTWSYVQQHMIWGMLILFAGGLAMGNLLEASGANAILARWLQGMELEPGLPLYTAIALLACLFSETAGITISSAMVVPLVITLTRPEGMRLLPS